MTPRRGRDVEFALPAYVRVVTPEVEQSWDWSALRDGARLSEVCVVVHGLPRPKGSGRAVMRPRKGQGPASARPIVVQDAKGLGAWHRAIMAAAVRVESGRRPWWPKAAALAVDLDFVLPPLTASRRKHRPWPNVRPDVDKLERAVLDAFTGIAYVDDGQVVSIRHSKRYGEPGGFVGVRVVVTEVTWTPSTGPARPIAG